ncbi:MAG: M48 family metalloprotease [Erythrobacter sp.]|jgi:beta-barrel assembly-enhancing protease|uniref:M48 family metalloprotease n=1 Tax=Qipengyuania vulgaris TaxID=291985 RepID=A0A844XQ51_9SPHN|nr:M48 family metallopeptidase [Qipengyuania vulgaris]MCH2497364.1 M48 family metalloprotease [Erythrobacter sp.]MXO48091.1 M48 family metalloprotease [Qipengyuania vulgaris]
MGHFRLAKAALIVASVIGATHVNAEPAPTPPPYHGFYQPQGVDEVGLWREDDESERRLAASQLVIQDEALNAYLKEVLCKTVGTDRCTATRIYVLREPTFNATMSPNGTMRVFSGMLLRMRSEAELAAILGHEFGHFEQRHSLKQFKERRTGSDLLAWGALLASMSPGYDARRTYQSLEISVYGNLYRYGRDQEREADLLGLGYLNQSSLRPQAASEVWQNLMGEIDASALARGLKKPKYNAIAFTASHPPHGERAGYLSELASPGGAIRNDGAPRYRQALAKWLPVFLEDQIKLNDFGASEYIIENLARNGWTPTLWHARGELYRTRGNQRDLVHAAQFYQNAIALDGNLAASYRGLGLSLFKTGERLRGQEALKQYLELAPDAEDAGMIRLMLPKET